MIIHLQTPRQTSVYFVMCPTIDASGKNHSLKLSMAFAFGTSYKRSNDVEFVRTGAYNFDEIGSFCNTAEFCLYRARERLPERVKTDCKIC